MSNSLWAYAKLGFNPGVQVLDVAARRVMHSLHQYNSQELANMLFSFATLEHHPGVQLLEMAALQIATRLDQFSPQVAVACWHSFVGRGTQLLLAAPRSFLTSFSTQPTSGGHSSACGGCSCFEWPPVGNLIHSSPQVNIPAICAWHHLRGAVCR